MNTQTQGWLNGFIGVAIFAGSLPATRIAVMDFDPFFLTAARACIAATLGFLVLCLTKQKIPQKSDLPALAMVAVGVVLGFPLLTALALQWISSAHSIVFLGVLPLFTAIFAVWRSGEHPRGLFWLFSLLGSLCVAGYAALNGGQAPWQGNILMLVAVMVCGLGYAEGARLSRTLGGWQVISWALLLACPGMLAAVCFTWPPSFNHISISAWLGLFYVSLFSMFIGFIFWYRGLALGGIAAVGQLQLLQPFLGLLLAALLLHETISTGMLLTTFGADLCVAGARKFSQPRPPR